MVKAFSVGPLSVNCSIVMDESTKKAFVIDPGADVEKILKELQGFELIGILATHGHIDHVGRVKTLKEMFNVPFYMHRKDVNLINDPIWRGFDSYIGADLPCPEPDVYIEEGEHIQVGSIILRVFHTPGHTPGLCCFYEEKEKVMIAGDLLFREGVGRWDLPGGNFEDLKNSLKRIFRELEDDVKVITGHYSFTTIGHERKFNPYVRDVL